MRVSGTVGSDGLVVGVLELVEQELPEVAHP